MVGGKKNLNHFFPFYEILAKFFAIFIILSPQSEIFIGLPPHRKPFKIFMIGGVSSKFTMGVPPHHPYLCPSLPAIETFGRFFGRVQTIPLPRRHGRSNRTRPRTPLRPFRARHRVAFEGLDLVHAVAFVRCQVGGFVPTFSGPDLRPSSASGRTIVPIRGHNPSYEPLVVFLDSFIQWTPLNKPTSGQLNLGLISG